MPTMTTYDGVEVDVEHVKPLPDGGARFDVEHPDGRRWQLDVSRNGDAEVVTSWRDGELANLTIPGWLEDLLGQLARQS